MEENTDLKESPMVHPNTRDAARQEDLKFYQQHTPISRSITSCDNRKLQLHADEYLNETAGSKWVVVVHGYMSKAKEMLRWVRGFYEKGYNVLALDLRGHGESEGDYIGMGWPNRVDLMKWIDEIVKNDSNAEIVLFGVSMGAATVMMASGEKLPPNVKVIVEDCGYSSVSGIFVHQLDDLFGLPEFPVINAANTVIKQRAGYDIYQASAVEQVAKNKTPMLFIHGQEDDFVPFEMLDSLYQATKGDKEKLIVPEAGHGQSVLVSPDLYWDTIEDFVGKYLSV